jgi:hypothetical protein
LKRLITGGSNSGADLQAAPPRQNQLPSVAADGAYKVLGISYEGDSRGNPWYMDLTCLSNATLAQENNAGVVPNSLLAAKDGPQP